jgi:hypothetical protein
VAEAAGPYQRKGIANVRESYCNLETTTRPLRAIVEIRDGELVVYPLAQTEADEREILDALRSATMCGDFAELLG